MTLTTEQARELAQRPRMTEAEVEQMIMMRANGMSAAEIAEQFPQYAAGTIFNKLSKRKAQVEDLRRARTVQCRTFLAPVRRPASTTIGSCVRPRRWLIQKHLESCYAADPVSGVLEFVEQLVDARKLKVYWDMVGKANRAIMIETGQQPQPAPGLNEAMMRRNLVGSSDLHLVDQGGDFTPRTVT